MVHPNDVVSVFLIFVFCFFPRCLLAPGVFVGHYPSDTKKGPKPRTLPRPNLTLSNPLHPLPTKRQRAHWHPETPNPAALLAREPTLATKARGLAAQKGLPLANRPGEHAANPSRKLALELKPHPARLTDTGRNWHPAEQIKPLELLHLNNARHLRRSDNLPRTRRKHQPRKKQDWQQTKHRLNPPTGQAKAQSSTARHRAASARHEATRLANANGKAKTSRERRKSEHGRKANGEKPNERRTALPEGTQRAHGKGGTKASRSGRTGRRSARCTREEEGRHDRPTNAEAQPTTEARPNCLTMCPPPP